MRRFNKLAKEKEALERNFADNLAQKEYSEDQIRKMERDIVEK